VIIALERWAGGSCKRCNCYNGCAPAGNFVRSSLFPEQTAGPGNNGEMNERERSP
jgi:hypothetical protein